MDLSASNCPDTAISSGLIPVGWALRSSPVRCDADKFNKRITDYVTNQDDYDAMVAGNTMVGDSCANLTGPSLNFLDTISAARDLDRVREVSGWTLGRSMWLISIYRCSSQRPWGMRD